MNIIKVCAFLALMSLGLQTVQAAEHEYQNHYATMSEKKEATDGFDLLMRNIWVKLGLLAGPCVVLGFAVPNQEYKIKSCGIWAGIWLTGMSLYHAKSEAKRLAD